MLHSKQFIWPVECICLVWAEKFHNNVKSKYYLRPKGHDAEFTISHFAGKVTYGVANFLEKNKNFLPTEVIHLLRQSSHQIIRFLFQCPLTKTGNLYYATPRASPHSSIPRSTVSSNKVRKTKLLSQTFIDFSNFYRLLKLLSTS